MNIKAFSSLALAASLALPTLAHAIDRQAALDGLVAAEKEFSDTAAKKGIRDSFLDFMAEDGVLFRPDPVNAREFLQSRPPAPGLLSWFPAYAEVSLAGDLGYDTGPAEYRASGKAEDKPERHQFASVWKRQADGSWKVVLDLGTQGNPPMPAAIALQGPAKVEDNSWPKVDFIPVRASVIMAEQALSGAIREKGAEAYAAVLTDDARLLRDERALISGKQAALDFLAQDKASVSWDPEGAGISRSGDLGYTYGIFKRREGDSWVKTDNYLRVWRRQPNGAWRLAFDVLSPRPKPAPKPAGEKKP